MSLGSHSSCKFQHEQTRRYNLFVCDVLGTALCTAIPRHVFPSKFVTLLVSGTFFFPTSEINEISISHLTQSDYAFFFHPQISDIWSNSKLFSYLTFSNNWALALAELASIISERKSLHFYSVLQVNRRGWYSVIRIPLLIFGYTQKLLCGGFWVASLKGWSFWLWFLP